MLSIIRNPVLEASIVITNNYLKLNYTHCSHCIAVRRYNLTERSVLELEYAL